ncbi:MAG: hypothetical protein R6X33_16010 [Candidatus Brocadiia bacterium]
MATERPGIVTFFGVGNLVLGGMQTLTALTSPAIDPTVIDRGWVAGLGVCLAMVASGVALLKVLPWGRILALVCAVYALLALAADWFALGVRGLGDLSMAFIVVGVVLSALQLAYWTGLLGFLTRARVKEAFATEQED